MHKNGIAQAQLRSTLPVSHRLRSRKEVMVQAWLYLDGSCHGCNICCKTHFKIKVRKYTDSWQIPFVRVDHGLLSVLVRAGKEETAFRCSPSTVAVRCASCLDAVQFNCLFFNLFFVNLFCGPVSNCKAHFERLVALLLVRSSPSATTA